MNKKLITLILGATLILTGCDNTDTSSEDTSSYIQQLDLADYFDVEIDHTILDTFMVTCDNYSMDEYIKNNICTFTIDDCVYSIKQSKFIDVMNNLKQYLANEDGLLYLNSLEVTNSSGIFNIALRLSNTTVIMVRFSGIANVTPIKDYVLSSFTVSYDINSAVAGDKLPTNFKCVVPFAINKAQYEAKMSENVGYDDDGINIYYTYHNADGFTKDGISVSGFSIRTAFNKEEGYLISILYEVNSK